MKKIKFFSKLLTSVLCASVFFSSVKATQGEIEEKPADTQKAAQELIEEKPSDIELVFVIDKSGSMHNLVNDTIGSFNSVIEEQKELETGGNVYVTTVLFNNGHNKIHDRIDLKNVSPIIVA
jgi:hypothetical protein